MSWIHGHSHAVVYIHARAQAVAAVHERGIATSLDHQSIYDVVRRFVLARQHDHTVALVAHQGRGNAAVDLHVCVQVHITRSPIHLMHT
jgi:hypothetical protein